MKIFIKAKTNARQEKVEKVDEHNFIVAVTESPIEGRANKAIIQALSEYFKIPAWKIEISAGHTSKSKIININT